DRPDPRGSVLVRTCRRFWLKFAGGFAATRSRGASRPNAPSPFVQERGSMFARGKISQRQSPPSKRRPTRPAFRPNLEALETRALPSLSSPISTLLGGQPTSPVTADVNGDGL